MVHGLSPELSCYGGSIAAYARGPGRDRRAAASAACAQGRKRLSCCVVWQAAISCRAFARGIKNQILGTKPDERPERPRPLGGALRRARGEYVQVTAQKWPSTAQRKAGSIGGATGRLFRSDFFTSPPSRRESRIYATGIREPSSAGLVEYGISRARTIDGGAAIYGWLRCGRLHWLSFEVAAEVEETFWVCPEDAREPNAVPRRWAPKRTARIPNEARVETWVEWRGKGYLVEWREPDGSVGSIPVEAAFTASDSALFAEVLATAYGYASIKPRMTIVQIARRMPTLIAAYRDAVDKARPQT